MLSKRLEAKVNVAILSKPRQDAGLVIGVYSGSLVHLCPVSITSEGKPHFDFSDMRVVPAEVVDVTIQTRYKNRGYIHLLEKCDLELSVADKTYLAMKVYLRNRAA